LNILENKNSRFERYKSGQLIDPYTRKGVNKIVSVKNRPDESGYGERMQTEPTDSFDHHSVPNAVSRLTVFFFAKILSIPML
jgi:hypothetical protein